jgi:4-methyl-5(b-hydroxyethyl)-thiazole monophosphate biosynthesis
MVYVFLAPGFEEIEALAVVDVLRRAELDVLTVGVGEDFVIGSHQIPVACDISEKALVLDEKVQAIVLPGGMPGTLNLEKSETVQKAIDWAIENDKLVCAICAAPLVLDDAGILDGKKFTCYPSTVSQIKTGEYCDKAVVADGKIITGKGVGTALDLGLAMVAIFCSEEKSESLKKAIVYGV